MKPIGAILRTLVVPFSQVRTLGMRALILTIVAAAVMNVSILTVLSGLGSDMDQGLRAPPMVRQAAAAAQLMDKLGPDDRILALDATSSQGLRLSLIPDFAATPPVENPIEVFVPIIALYSDVMGDRPFSVYKRTHGGIWDWSTATLADDLIIVVRLADGAGLVIENGAAFRRLVSLYGVALIVGLLSLVLIGLMTWASLSYARPLNRLAMASKQFVAAASAAAPVEPLPEIGPRPVRDLAAALNLAGAKLMQLTIERTSTLAAVAHDLRTYLTRLRMRSEFIEDVVQRDKAIRDIDDMTQLVEDTLLLGHAAKWRPLPERVDLARWLQDFVERRHDMGEPVRLSITARTADVMAATPELTRILNNLVDNALRYAGTANLVLKTDAPDAVEVEVEVWDDGPGVPEAFLGRMTDPFTRLETSRSRDTGGAGLGLAITKALTEQIGGTLHLANRNSGGFSARVTFAKADAKARGVDA
jgi:signal transduction histidine kinase